MKDLYLFDIDGTLVDMTNLHVAAYQTAYRSVVGRNVTRELLVSKFGKVERQIHEEVFQELRISDKGKIDKVISKYESSIVDVIESVDITLLPGVADFLKYLKEKDVYLGVITGNPPLVGSSILGKTHLTPFFSIFSYGEIVENREGIVAHAIKEANKRGYRFNKVVVIGDSPTDIKAGKSVGAFTVGVATGHYDKGKLEEAGADLVLDTLIQYDKVLDALK